MLSCNLLLFIFVGVVGLANGIDHPEELVNLLAGSFTDGDRFSTGNTLPLVGRPWGFNHWAPQTKDGGRNTGSWWFKGSDHVLTWLRCTHQPSPWIGDWGWFLFSPQIGPITRSPIHFWEPRGAVMKPYLFDAYVAPFGMRIELTPTDHAAYLRVTFPASSEHGDKSVCFSEADWDSKGVTNDGTKSQYMNGRSMKVRSERLPVMHFAMHIRVESEEATGVNDQTDLRCFRYKPDATVVHIRMATSLISQDQAQVNLNRELKIGKSFDEVLTESKMVWNKLMKRVDVINVGDVGDANNKRLSIFYTGLYRGLMFPRRLDEVTSAGKVVHYSPYSPRGGVFDGVLVTDNGFWDTFRTVYPMLSLIYPDHLGTIVQGWLNAYKEGGWLPSWASPGYRNCMVGTFADVVIADAIVKGVQGFDLNTAREALMKDSFESPPRHAGSAAGKEGLDEYSSRGYLASEGQGGAEVVSRTLDYGFADYSTAQAFLVLTKKEREEGNTDIAETLERKAKELQSRATNAYTNLFDKGRGLMVPKNRNGQFSDRFSSIEWGNGYTEGNSWHHSFPPYAIIPSGDTVGSALRGCQLIESGLRHCLTTHPLDPFFTGGEASAAPGGLVTLYGGKDALLRRLHKLLEVPGNFRVGSYGQEIHEMTEARAVAMGQYSHNNQPVHHILYLFAVLGERRVTEELVRRVMDRAYGMDFYAGDEDNGEMGSWYVLSALGLYSIVPGTRDYVVGSPVFRHVRINRNAKVKYDTYYETPYNADVDRAVETALQQDAKYLDIFALGTSPTVMHVDKVLVDGQQVHGPLIDDNLLQGDGILQFVMEGEAKAVSGLSSVVDVNAIHAMKTFPNSNNYNLYSTSSEGAKPAVVVKTVNKKVIGVDDVNAVSVDKLESEISKQAMVITQLKEQLQRNSVGGGGKVQVVASGAYAAAGEAEPHEPLSTLTLFTILLLVFIFAVLLAKVLELLGVFPSSTARQGGLSVGDGGYEETPASPQAYQSQNVCMRMYIYTTGLWRAAVLWLSSDSISNTVVGSKDPVVNTVGSKALLRWGKAQSHTV